jgi:LacI family transcriptional regulator
MADFPRVALLVESSRASGRSLLRGIADYVRAHRPWIVFHQERALGDAAPAKLSQWGADGIIARIENRQLVRQIQRWGLPTVDVLGWHPIPGVPRMGNDRRAVARMAVDHLRQRGLESFAYCGFPGLVFSDQRAAEFADYVVTQGFRVDVYQGTPPRRPASVAKIEARGLLQERSLAAWLRSLTKPVGMMACNDSCAQQVLNVCRDCGIDVPGQIVLVGVDNDDVLCELSSPPLSSISLNNERIGYEAAALLDRMLRGIKPEVEEVRFPPLGVVARRSTDTFFVTDADVATAVRFIHDHACEAISVQDVVNVVSVSPSTLKRRFARFVGQSPKAYILRVQLDRARALLACTGLEVRQIAGKCGFVNVEWFCKLFKKTTGITPTQWRDQFAAK